MLGIIFSCNLDTIIDVNYNTKIIEIEKEIKQRAKGILTPLGRLTVLKMLLVSKLNHISLPNPSAVTISKLNKAYFEFIWRSSTARIKREVIIHDFEQGSSRMIHLEKYVYALKLGWLRKLVKYESKYKTLFQNLNDNIENILTIGNTYIEELRNNCRNKFWHNVLDAWYNFIKFLRPRSKEDIMGINLWKNSNIKVNNRSVFFRRWYGRNIIFTIDIFYLDKKILS